VGKSDGCLKEVGDVPNRADTAEHDHCHEPLEEIQSAKDIKRNELSIYPSKHNPSQVLRVIHLENLHPPLLARHGLQLNGLIDESNLSLYFVIIGIRNTMHSLENG